MTNRVKTIRHAQGAVPSEGVSGRQSRRSLEAVEVRPRRCGAAARKGPLYGGRAEQRHARRHDRGAAEASICNDVLHGLVRGILRDQAVVVVMMRLLLPMKHHMRRLFHITQRLQMASDGQGLPEGRDQQD